MKKLLLVIALSLRSINLEAQGLVFFGNSQSSLLTTSDGERINGTNFMVNLYYNSSNDAQNPPAHDAFTPLGFPVTHIFSGRYNGGIRTTPPDTPPGGAAWFQVRVWQRAFGETYEEVLMNPEAGGRGFGVSNPFFHMTGTLETGPTSTGSNPAFTGVIVDVVPEPSTVLLAMLGMSGLLIVRQRKV